MFSSHFEPKCKIAWKPTELSGPLLYEVIDLDSKPVKVSLDFDEKYLPFYCNLLTRPDFPLCALAWVLKSHKIDWDRYLSREEGGKSFLLPSLCNVIGNHTITSLKKDKPEHGPRVRGVPASMLHFWKWNWPYCYSPSQDFQAAFLNDKVTVKCFIGVPLLSKRFNLI